ncbi:MFS glucose transporter mfs1 [Cladobotryum mycophilum]|uniref:MFS glucose transporter mfs1 n=1 Tax=Cladobotryum mycophilum TaxID=491253 RepID=A0ABR0STT8_9HYPO
MYQATNVYFICSFAAIGGGLFGFDISSISGILGTAAYKRYFNNPISYAQGGITASMPAGSFVGSLCSSFIADKLSRKFALQIACVLWIIGSAIQCAAQNVEMLCAGRVVAGLCVGIASSVVPIYQAEIAPKEIRGRVVSFQQWAITWGILIQYFIQYGCAEAVGGGPNDPNQSTAAFRIPWGIQMVPAWILFFGLFFFPHSPRWLASKDRWEEALQVLADLHGNGSADHPRVLAQYREIENALRFEKEQTNGKFAALLQKHYIVYIMEGAQIGTPLLTASIQYIINVVFTLPAILFLDKWGRRPSLVIGAFLMMTWLFISGGLQHYYGEPNRPGTRNKTNTDITWVIIDNKPVSIAIVFCSYLFVATFATTWGPTSWTYPAEIFPSKIRARAVSLSTATNWLCNMALAFAVPPMFNAVAFIHMFLCAPETKGYTLEEMDEVFDSNLPAWRKLNKKSRLDELEFQIQQGNVKVLPPGPGTRTILGKRV